MATEVSKMVSYYEGLLPLKLFDISVIWSGETVCQIKIITSPLPQCPCQQTFTG